LQWTAQSPGLISKISGVCPQHLLGAGGGGGMSGMSGTLGSGACQRQISSPFGASVGLASRFQHRSGIRFSQRHVLHVFRAMLLLFLKIKKD
jgi:hypothetical protein